MSWRQFRRDLKIDNENRSGFLSFLLEIYGSNADPWAWKYGMVTRSCPNGAWVMACRFDVDESLTAPRARWVSPGTPADNEAPADRHRLSRTPDGGADAGRHCLDAHLRHEASGLS